MRKIEQGASEGFLKGDMRMFEILGWIFWVVVTLFMLSPFLGGSEESRKDFIKGFVATEALNRYVEYSNRLEEKKVECECPDKTIT